MISRILEPEVMDSVAEAVDYNSMDHREVNRVFVDDFLTALHRYDSSASPHSSASRSRQAPVAPNAGIADQPGVDTPGSPVDTPGSPVHGSAASMRVLDVGTGTALIPIELCRRPVFCHVTAVDLAGEMLKLAEKNVRDAGFQGQIVLERIDAKNLPYDEGRFDAVISNSIVHHIPEPKTALAEMIRVLRTGGLLCVRDLLRPGDLETLDKIVTRYAGDAGDHQRQMFGDSLRAALTLEEVRKLLADLGCPEEWARQTTDRHWTILGHRIRI